MNARTTAPPVARPGRRARTAPRAWPRPAPLAVRLARARIVLLRRREDRFGWLSLCLVLALAAAALLAAPAPALAGGAGPDALLLVPRIGARLPVAPRADADGLVVSAPRRTLEDLVENDLVCIQHGGRPLSWYRVLRVGGARPDRPGALLLDGRASGPRGGAGDHWTAVALPVASPDRYPPSTNRASRNPR